MDNHRPLAVPAYLTAFLLVLVPILDAALSVLPLRLGAVAWRFGAAGLLSRALPLSLLGALLALAVALLLAHRRTLRALSYLAGLATVVLVAAAMLFVLDAIQLRAQVNADTRSAFDLASLVALGKIGFGAAITLALAVVARRAARREAAISRAQATRKGAAGGLLLGAKARPTELTTAESA